MTDPDTRTDEEVLEDLIRNDGPRRGVTMPNQMPRPPLDETLAHIDAVLDEPEHPPLVVHRSTAEFTDRIGQLEWAAGPPATEDQLAAFRAVDDAIRRQFARAIGWFRR